MNSFPASPCSSPAKSSGAGLPSPHALLFFLSHQDTYRRPLFSPHEVFCGPDTEDRIGIGPSPSLQSVQSLRTPVGSFDVAEIVARLPAEQQPELVVVKADATGRIFPRNLASLKCPRVLLVGDTHHLRQPLQTVLRYAQEEPFDFIILDHTRHHAPWFRQADFKNLYWLPALDYGYVPRAIASAPSRPLTFVGQAGAHHPWRREVLARVRAAGLPLAALTAPLAQTADLYADSQITLNISLNGDLNLRVFESLAAGGFLLTDELGASSGLSRLFTPGEHLDTWRTPGELIEKIRHYQGHPDEIRRIRTAGQQELNRAHHPDVKLREFYDLIHSGRVNPRYDLATDPHVFSLGGIEADATLLPAYELLQSLHQVSERVVVFCPDDLKPTGTPSACTATQAKTTALHLLVDLPRIWLRGLSELSGASAAATATGTPQPKATDAGNEGQVLWWPEGRDGLAAALTHFRGRHILASSAASEVLAEWGYTAAGPGVYLFTDPGAWLQSARAAGVREFPSRQLAHLLSLVESSDDALALADIAGEMNAVEIQHQALQRALFLDRNCVPALLQLVAFALRSNERPSAAILLGEAARVAPLPPRFEALRAELLAAHATNPEIAVYRNLTDPSLLPRSESPRRVLLVTNLFPPEELGGYGRMMWEFAHGLRARGHEVNILCGHADYLRKPPTADEVTLEHQVSRELTLLGEWREGVARPVGPARQLAQLAAANASRVVNAALSFGADLVLLGNLDFLGTDLLHAVLNAGFPVLHTLANAGPGYIPAEQPTSPRYWVAPCSHWNGAVFQRDGYRPANLGTLYPGARLENFFRWFYPDARRLRVAYASLVMPYKGAHILIEALGRLHQAGIAFTAEIAGDSTDPIFLARLQAYVNQHGMADRVKFTGFLDRSGLAALFARSNVLVFPSQFDEPFGISQVEALASGLVVVTSGTGGAAEIISDGVDGLRFPAAEAGALAQRLALLALNPARFQELQRQGRRRSLDFSVRAAVVEIERRMELLCAPATAAVPAAECVA